MSLPSIPKIYRFGERFTNGITSSPVVVEEKYDGSQFTFGMVDGALCCRSKSQDIDLSNPGMFAAAVETARRIFDEGNMSEGEIFLCEYISRPRHNVLTYSRTPKGFLVLCDVAFRRADDQLSFAPPELLNLDAYEMGLEACTVLFKGDVTQEILEALLDHESSLGGTKIEGVVIKNYKRQHSERGNWPQTAKLVSDQFKERAKVRPHNPKAEAHDVVQRLVNALRTEARWMKAVQHLREAGQLTGTSVDIGPLCRELQRDTLEEESDWIGQQLLEEFSKDIAKGVVNGFALWYKDLLAGGWSAWHEEQTKTKSKQCE